MMHFQIHRDTSRPVNRTGGRRTGGMLWRHRRSPQRGEGCGGTLDSECGLTARAQTRGCEALLLRQPACIWVFCNCKCHRIEGTGPEQRIIEASGVGIGIDVGSLEVAARDMEPHRRCWPPGAATKGTVRAIFGASYGHCLIMCPQATRRGLDRSAAAPPVANVLRSRLNRMRTVGLKSTDVACGGERSLFALYSVRIIRPRGS